MAKSIAHDPNFFVFLSSLLGRPVLNAAGHRLGRVNDLVVHTGEMYPRVTALVVAVRRAPRVRIPWGEVADFGAGPFHLRLATLANLPAPSFAEHEVPLSEAVLDRQIVDTDGAKVERVNDLHLIRVERSLRVAHVDIGVRGLVRRLGWERWMDAAFDWLFSHRVGDRFVSWKYVQLIPSAYSHGVQFGFPIQKLSLLHPADLAEIVEDLSIHESSQILTSLDVQTAAQTLSEVDPDVQTSIVEVMDRDQASDIIEEMPPEEAADLLGELPDEVAKDVLESFEEEEHADEVRELLSYDEDTAGGLMTNHFMTLPTSLTAGEALARLRQFTEDPWGAHYVYLLAPDERLLGVASLRDLLLASPESPLTAFVGRRLVSVVDGARPREVVELLVKYDLRAVPVLDADGTMKGVIDMHDAVKAAFPEVEGE
jgi:CBS domain-containing protein